MGEKQLLAEALILLTVSCALEIQDKINTKSLRLALKWRSKYMSGIFEIFFKAGWYSCLPAHPRS